MVAFCSEGEERGRNSLFSLALPMFKSISMSDGEIDSGEALGQEGTVSISVEAGIGPVPSCSSGGRYEPWKR